MRTPSQTIGPFFHFSLCERPANRLGAGDIRLAGRVVDGGGQTVDDALVELWHPELGFGRAATDHAGRFEFVVSHPPEGYFEAMVFARGLLRHLVTRIYLPGADDDFLASLPERDRSSLIAERNAEGFRFDIHLQGERETPFFAV